MGPEQVRPENVIPLPVPAIVLPQASEPVVEKRQISAKLPAVRDALAARDEYLGADRRATLVEKVVQDWRMTPRGLGYTAFFRLGAALNWAGLDLCETQAKLWQEATYGYACRKRQYEIKYILESLGRRGTLTGSGRSSRNRWD